MKDRTPNTSQCKTTRKTTSEPTPSPPLLSPAITTCTACIEYLSGRDHLDAREHLSSACSHIATRLQAADRVQNSTAVAPAACAIQLQSLIGSEVTAQRVAVIATSTLGAPSVFGGAHLSFSVRVLPIAVEGACVPLLVSQVQYIVRMDSDQGFSCAELTPRIVNSVDGAVRG